MLTENISGNLAGVGIVFLSQVLGASQIRGTELVRWHGLELRESFSASLWGGSVWWGDVLGMQPASWLGG